MTTRDYIIQYSELYAELEDADEHINNYTLISNPTMGEMCSQIELHMFWKITPPETLIYKLEDYLRRGILFAENFDIYYHIDEQYWPLVKHFTKLNMPCRDVRNEDFTYSMALYRMAPHAFEITKYNYNSLECLKTIDIPSDMNRAAQIGDIDCIKYLRNKNVDYGYAMAHAAHSGKIDCVMYLYTHNAPTTDAISHAAYNGHIECIDYLYQRGEPFECALSNAAQGGHLQCVEYLYENGAQVYDAMELAASHGNVECMVYLHSKGVSWGSAMNSAAMHDKLEVMKLLHSNSVSWSNAINYAAASSIACLEYMYEHGATWDGGAMNAAVWASNLECIKFLHKHGAPWGEAPLFKDHASTECRAYIAEHAPTNN